MKRARIHQPTPQNLRYLADELKRGQLVAIPTETVYGLAADALNAKACRKIFKAKRRPANDPLIVHVLGLREAEQLAHFTPLARKLAKHFWPGPLTLVLPKKTCVPSLVTSGGDTVAIRAPKHPLARRLLRFAGIPLAAPSANSFGYISPTEAEHVADNLGAEIEHILDGGPCSIGVESTILDLSDAERPRILRAGSVTADTLTKVLKPVLLQVVKPKKNDHERQLAPGMLTRHYSPRTPLQFLGKRQLKSSANTAVIYLRKPPGKIQENNYWFSQRGNLREIARNLYRVLRRADANGHKQIFVAEVPTGSGGLGIAINDRLTRAAAK